MTTPTERTRALIVTRQFLNELLDHEKHPEITSKTRDEVRWCLRHYPEDHNINAVALTSPDQFSRADDRHNGN